MSAPRPRRSRALALVAAAAGVSLTLSACAGSAGGGSDEAGSSGSGEGFEYDAPQEDVDAVLEDLDPVTLTFQPSAASQNSVMAPAGTVFKDIVEERSGGKIKVDIVWGQAIAGWTEVNDALADGRIDVAYTLPVYEPTEFPAINDLGTSLAGLSSSPFVGEMVANAVGSEIAWDNENVLEQYEAKGLVPLNPLAASGGYYTVCSDPVETAQDWDGLQVRIASTAQAAQVENLGGTPVSMEYGETFEALQRGTVDCTLGQLVPSAEAGVFEVAPELGYTTDSSFSRSPGAYLAGSTYQELPLAYQQIIFDSMALASSGGMQAIIGGNADAVSQAKEAGGQVAPFADDIQDEIRSYSEELTSEAVANGEIPEDIQQVIADSAEQWTTEFEGLGYTDKGETKDFDQWYDPETDYTAYAEAVYENGAAMEHRPS
ncbi:TRAP transporter substrate-binding protein DctP [Nocardioides insulae]|uniref:TRAP transporter substrate-binding protein DctP n=1 Tax=Nocardioides insulae TaxID=394734 RepID=UPI00048DEB18|nr:TRAP transporter substrate-binding protein DctP [Nocardioides insulae]